MPPVFGRCPLCGRRDVPLIIEDSVEQCGRCYVLLGGTGVDFVAERAKLLRKAVVDLETNVAELAAGHPAGGRS